MEQVLQELMMDNTQLHQKLQSSTQQLERKEAELTVAKETIRRQLQQIQEMVCLVCGATSISLFNVYFFCRLSYCRSRTGS